MTEKLDDELEDYDALEFDKDTLVHGSHGGDGNSLSARQNGSASRGEGGDGLIRKESVSHSNGRRSSFHVRLEQTGEEGTYILTADDPEIKELLQSGLAREREGDVFKRKKRLRDLVFTRQFTTFDRQNPLSSESPFHGFFTLFWLAMLLMFFQVMARNWRMYGSVVGTNELLKMMFNREVVVLGLTDLAMLLSTLVTFSLQRLVNTGIISWSSSGWILQNVWQSMFLAGNIGWTYYREWPWTHTVFMVLHVMVYIMKQHSYAFYNGHLSGVLRRKKLLQQRLTQLAPHSRSNSRHLDVTSGAASGISESAANEESANLLQRHKSSATEKASTDLSQESSDVAQVYRAMESGKPLNAKQVEAFRRVIKAEIADLDVELQGKATSPTNAYPNNLTVGNFVEWTCLPTLVYELEYPRLDKINWWYVAEKTLATFGVIAVMMVISQAYIYPPVAQVVRMKEAGMTLSQRAEELPWLISDMLFPMLLEQLLSWYVIWECVLNVLAEVTRFADRGFYGDWWNSVSMDQYARDWNRPVHNFLLRHVYHSSISTFHLSKTSATFVTFLLSALVHELVMACLFQKVRGYLFFMQLMQIPLITFSRSKLMKGRDLLGNVVFWTGLFIGPSVLMSCYLLI